MNNANIARERNFYWIVAGLIIGIIWMIWEFLVTLAQYAKHNVNLTFIGYLINGGFMTLLIPIIIGLLGYFGYRIIVIFTILGFVGEFIYDIVSKTERIGPTVLILGFLTGIITENIFRLRRKIMMRSNKSK